MSQPHDEPHDHEPGAPIVTADEALRRLIDGNARFLRGSRGSRACGMKCLPPDEQLARAVEANVRWNMRQIRETPEGQARLDAGIFKLVGAIYDIASGRVRFLEPT